MADFDPTTPSIARVYDYWLNGKDNFAADRELGDRLTALHCLRIVRGVKVSVSFDASRINRYTPW